MILHGLSNHLQLSPEHTERNEDAFPLFCLMLLRPHPQKGPCSPARALVQFQGSAFKEGSQNGRLQSPIKHASKGNFSASMLVSGRMGVPLVHMPGTTEAIIDLIKGIPKAATAEVRARF